MLAKAGIESDSVRPGGIRARHAAPAPIGHHDFLLEKIVRSGMVLRFPGLIEKKGAIEMIASIQ
jgi:hypothetical protein